MFNNLNSRFLKLLPALSLCLVFTMSDLCAQEYQYSIFKGKQEIGEMKTKKEVGFGSTSYSINSTSKFRFLVQYVLDYLFEAEYQDGQLAEASVLNLLNGKEKSATYISFNGENLEADIDGEPRQIDEVVSYSVAPMYFEEPPKDVSQVFSERWGDFVPLKRLRDSFYEMTLPNGRKTTYNYINGELMEVQINHTLATLLIKRK